jgi:pyruvate formate lyase activating enzyme
VHTAIETCGHVDFDRLTRLLPHTDLFLYDIKETDPSRHEDYTGVTNRRILENLKALHDADATILVRLPTIPGLNDRTDHFHSVAALVGRLPRLLGVEVMPYHSLGTSKRNRFGFSSDGVPDPTPPDAETVSRWIESLRALGVNVVNDA